MTIGFALISINQHNFGRDARQQERIGCRRTHKAGTDDRYTRNAVPLTLSVVGWQVAGSGHPKSIPIAALCEGEPIILTAPPQQSRCYGAVSGRYFVGFKP